MPLTLQAGAVLERLMSYKQLVAVRGLRMSVLRAIAPAGFCNLSRPT